MARASSSSCRVNATTACTAPPVARSDSAIEALESRLLKSAIQQSRQKPMKAPPADFVAAQVQVVGAAKIANDARDRQADRDDPGGDGPIRRANWFRRASDQEDGPYGRGHRILGRSAGGRHRRYCRAGSMSSRLAKLFPGRQHAFHQSPGAFPLRRKFSLNINAFAIRQSLACQLPLLGQTS